MRPTNHLKTSAANAPKLGAMRKFAEGGLIGKIFGASKPETITEKFARQDAEFKAKHPERFQDNAAPAQATPVQPVPAGLGGIRGMASGSIARNLQDREKAAGLYKGGMVRKKCVEGGEISGPGGPTDDLVPIDASNGEFMIKASSAKILGEDVLEALNDLGDEPKDPKKDAAEDAKEGEAMKCGGMVRKMAAGGAVDPSVDPMAGQYGHAAVGAPIDQGAAMDRNLLAKSAATATAQTPTTTPQQPRVLRGSAIDALNSYKPLPIPQLKCGGMVRNPKKMVGGGWTQENQADLDKRVTQIPEGGSAPAPDGSNTGSDFTRNVANTAMALPGVGGALSGGTALASAVPSIARGASAAAPLMGKGLGMVKTAAPYAVPAAGYAALQAASSSASPMPTSSTLEQVPVKPAMSGPATMPATTATPGTSQAPADEFSNAAIAMRNPGGMVRKVGNSYSGSNVSGDVSFQGADGNALPGRTGGGSMVVGSMSPELIKKTLTNPDGSTWSAGDNAIMAANIRDGVDQYRGTSRDPRNDPRNQPMTKEQRAAGVQMAQIASQDKRHGEQNAIAQENLGMSRTEHTAKMAAQKQLADAQAEYLAAGDDPVKLKAAERKLITLGGKQPAAVRQMVVPGGQGFAANGVPYTLASSVYDPDTKQFIQQPHPAQAQPAPGAVSMLKANPKLAADFDAKYGPGSAKQILGQ